MHLRGKKKFFETYPQLSLTLIFIFYRQSHLTYMFLLGILTKIAITSAAGFVDLSGFNLSLTSCALSSSFSSRVCKSRVSEESSQQHGYFRTKWSYICDGEPEVQFVSNFKGTLTITVLLNYPIIGWKFCCTRLHKILLLHKYHVTMRRCY